MARKRVMAEQVRGVTKAEVAEEVEILPFDSDPEDLEAGGRGSQGRPPCLRADGGVLST
ncbi:MAG: hypothetical protein OXD46_09040 [Chloroflexi bacterium]|nr:hypothetical protein [Chloroflexota bacterium]